MHIFDSEKNILELLWDRGELTAREISDTLAETVGWNRNTTYTVIKKCVAKGLVERKDPHFVCRALVSREEARSAEARSLLNSWFGGSASLFFASLLEQKDVSPEELARLRQRLDKEEES
ncbi:MAG: BlaI/MecI/CopY family transcriptional regulator [Clostridia bacterium]|nr:BlaI/MecI/CopY family transcriptional regulator [Clostridia bacterium]